MFGAGQAMFADITDIALPKHDGIETVHPYVVLQGPTERTHSNVSCSTRRKQLVARAVQPARVRETCHPLEHADRNLLEKERKRMRMAASPHMASRATAQPPPPSLRAGAGKGVFQRGPPFPFSIPPPAPAAVQTDGGGCGAGWHGGNEDTNNWLPPKTE